MGQVKALETTYKVKLHTLPIKKEDSAIKKAIKTLCFELKAMGLMLCARKILIRHNPKTPLTLISAAFWSWVKPVYIEQNTLTSYELAYLGRNLERFVHHVLLNLLRMSRVKLIAVNPELKTHLETVFGYNPKRVIYLENGYTKPQHPPGEIEVDKLNALKALKERGYTLALFIGNGYKWHGLSEILEVLAPHKKVKLIVVGPYPTQVTDQAIFLGRTSPATLAQLYGYCHFAVGAFRWDLLRITEGSPLKSREYLCHGLPVLVNYKDTAQDHPELAPFVYNQQKDPESLRQIIVHTHTTADIKEKARRCLSWSSVWKSEFLSD